MLKHRDLKTRTKGLAVHKYNEKMFRIKAKSKLKVS